MLSANKGVFGSSISLQDKIMYMASLELNHSLISDDNAKIADFVETILGLVTSESTRYDGLQLLEIALQQKPDLYYYKGKWVTICFNSIKDSRVTNLEKIQVCKVLNIIIPYLASDSSVDAKEELIQEIYPTLLERINENAEWAEEACNIVKMCLKTFPTQLAYYEGLLLDVVLYQASKNVSSKSFEVLAECFCEIPYCSKVNTADVIKGRWKELYLKTLKTIETLKNLCLNRLNNNDDSFKLGIDVQEFRFKDDNGETFFNTYVKCVRRFINLSKCLAKLLSTKSRYPVKVPIQCTLKCLIPLYTVCKKEKGLSNEDELLYTFIAQMQLAGLVVLESLILNCNLLKNTVLMKDLILVSLRSSKTCISSELVSELRIAVWRLLRLWVNGFGRSVSKDIAENSDIVEDLLKDINIDPNESFQMNVSVHKSKKSTSSTSSSKSVLKKRNLQRTCEEALKSLKSLLHTGALDFPKGIFQEICNSVFKICQTIQSSCDPFPSPYHDETCRRKLYSVVLAIAVVLKPDEVQSLQTAMIILTHANNDPSFKVRTFSNKAPAIYRLQLYPKRPLPICSDNKQRQLNVSDERMKYSEWSTEEYVQNIKAKNVSETPENVHSNVEQSFQNQSEVEIHSEDYMEVSTHYPEQVVENQCNGEDILEIQSSSQCQDDEESEDEDEDEDDEERSYGEEEMNQEEPQQEMYIPPTRKVQISNPVQMDSETVQSITEPEYEELTTPVKTEEKLSKNSNINTCINGDDTVMHNEGVPSSSAHQPVANENGIFGVDEDEDLDEDNDEEEDEEEIESYPAETREEIYDPPLKKQKLETKEDAEEERKEKSRSPTLEEMKADLRLPSIEDVRCGKVQLSTS